MAVLFLTPAGNPALSKMGNWLVVRTPVEHVDLIIALGGDRLRQEKAVELYRQGIARFILFTGADSRERDYGCLGLPPEATLPIAPAVFTTGGEADAVRGAVEQKKIRSILIVTSPYHSRRALGIFRRAFRGRGVEIEIATCDYPAFLLQPWWKSHMGQKTVLTEYFGLAYYWLRGGV
jgi:uncharacterized SAM-binding protein YcdF (DUF218 family)